MQEKLAAGAGRHLTIPGYPFNIEKDVIRSGEIGMSKRPYEKKKHVKNGVMRVAFAILAGLVEISVLLVLIMMGSYRWKLVSVGIEIVGFIVVLLIYSQERTASLKIPWIIFILTIPGFGLLMYVFVGLSASFLGLYKRYRTIEKKLKPYRQKSDDSLHRLKEIDSRNTGVGVYLQKTIGYGLYDDSDITYFGETTECLDDMIANLEKAEKFIFMEYYAIENSTAFGRILDVLSAKVKEGVLVRVFYDDLGSISFVDMSFAKMLRDRGIECRTFNPFSFFFNVFLNNHDHRKIMVIDGKIGYTGGFNLANEYFHITKPYGDWKDAGVRIEGKAVRALTLIFLENWNALRKRKQGEADYNFSIYLPDYEYIPREKTFIQPYGDSPMDNEQTGENVYLNIISKAEDYVYISTPYLIITDEMVSALTLAAKRGVDVCLITPGIPDKKFIYSMTRSYYHMLARDGVRIFEYTPGFNHCKLCVADDCVATCGTFNFDYRSLYHNFEDGCIFYHCDAVMKEKEDLLEMMSVSREVTKKYEGKRAGMLRAGQVILRLIAPLL